MIITRKSVYHIYYRTHTYQMYDRIDIIDISNIPSSFRHSLLKFFYII